MKNKVIWISNFTIEFYNLFFNIADNLILNWHKVIFLFPNNTLKIILKNRWYKYIDKKSLFEKKSEKISKILFWESESFIPKYLINYSKNNDIETIFFENWYFQNTFQVDKKWQNQKSSIYNLKYHQLLKYSRNIPNNYLNIKIINFNLLFLEKIKIVFNIKNTFKSIKNYLRFKKLEKIRLRILTKEKNIQLKEWKYIFIPFQVHDDSQIRLYSDIVKSMDNILNYFYNDLKKILPDYKIIVKEHPMDLWRIDYSKLRKKYNDIIWLQWWNLEQIINISEYVIVTNSSVWLQCLEKWKKVLLLWNAIYENNPFIEKIESIQDFKNKLLKLKNKKNDIKDINKYIKILKSEIFFSWSYKNFKKSDLKNLLNYII